MTQNKLNDEDAIRWFLIPPAPDGLADVHTEHCCARHGCKYGDDDCPVALGQKAQSYLCESCTGDELDLDLLREVQGRLTEEQWEAYQNQLWAEWQLQAHNPGWPLGRVLLHASCAQKIKALTQILRKTVSSARYGEISRS
jgi:hypothetical protein